MIQGTELEWVMMMVNWYTQPRTYQYCEKIVRPVLKMRP